MDYGELSRGAGRKIKVRGELHCQPERVRREHERSEGLTSFVQKNNDQPGSVSKRATAGSVLLLACGSNTTDDGDVSSWAMLAGRSVAR